MKIIIIEIILFAKQNGERGGDIVGGNIMWKFNLKSFVCWLWWVMSGGGWSWVELIWVELSYQSYAELTSLRCGGRVCGTLQTQWCRDIDRDIFKRMSDLIMVKIISSAYCDELKWIRRNRHLALIRCEITTSATPWESNRFNMKIVMMVRLLDLTGNFMILLSIPMGRYPNHPKSSREKENTTEYTRHIYRYFSLDVTLLINIIEFSPFSYIFF